MRRFWMIVFVIVLIFVGIETFRPQAHVPATTSGLTQALTASFSSIS